jgi:hypothetical protein
MNLIKKLGLSLALAGLMTSLAQAASITGGISFGGDVTLRLGNGGAVSTVASATWIDFSSSNIIVTSSSGSYNPAVAPGSPATFTDYLFEDGVPGPGAPVGTLWTIPGLSGATLTGATQTVLTRDISSGNPNDHVLTLKGTGTLNLNGFDPTFGTWTISVTQGQGTFGFGSSASSVPDGGSTVILLGGAILGLLGISKKLRFLA